MFSAGDVIILDFLGVEGVKRRPCVVLSSNTYHNARPDIIVGLVTSQTSAAIGPTDYVLQDWAAVGLRKPSAFRSFLSTHPQSSVKSQVGRLSDRDWQAVCDRVETALAVFENA